MTRLLDLTRLASRAGLTLTGVDRVEYQYLAHFLALDTPVFGLVRTNLGFVLLDRQRMSDFKARLDREFAWGPPDTLGRLAWNLPDHQKRAYADLRRLALARGRHVDPLVRELPDGARYINVGHSNLSHKTLAGLRSGGIAQISVMMHDVIPLTHPEFQSQKTPDRFRALVDAVAAEADVVIYNSHWTARETASFLPARPERCSVVAHLGLDHISEVAPEPLPFEIKGPFAVTLGTIEPRKNHKLLLDVWEGWTDDAAPTLVIAGHRGWRNEDVFARLDRKPPNIIEAPGLSDGQLVTLYRSASAALFPSFVEGYGFPPMEALLHGCPVICAPLPVYHEVLGDLPVYADPHDVYQWKQSINSLLTSGERPRPEAFKAPTWETHFKSVLTVT